MNRILRAAAAALIVLGIAVGGSSAVYADQPTSPPGQGECDHGNSQQSCRPDPQPSNGQDCDQHGNNGGVNEDHCQGGPSSTPTSTPSDEPSVEPSIDPTPSPTSTPSQSPSPTPTPSPSGTPTPRGTDEPTPTPTATPSATPVTSEAPSSTTPSAPTATLPPTDAYSGGPDSGGTGGGSGLAGLLIVIGLTWFAISVIEGRAAERRRK